MTATIEERVDIEEPKVLERDHVVTVTRRRIDNILVWLGMLAAAVLLVAGFLLNWGSNFAEDYVTDELSSQNITFPPEDSLIGQGREDLAQYGGMQVTTGEHAEAYASYIEGHVAGIADGMTYAEVPDRAARAAVVTAIEEGAPADEVAELQATADELTAQRDSIFRGETLRGLLLNTYAWSVIGRIAGIAAVVAFFAAGVTFLLVAAGVVHLRRMH